MGFTEPQNPRALTNPLRQPLKLPRLAIDGLHILRLCTVNVPGLIPWRNVGKRSVLVSFTTCVIIFAGAEMHGKTPVVLCVSTTTEYRGFLLRVNSSKNRSRSRARPPNYHRHLSLKYKYKVRNPHFRRPAHVLARLRGSRGGATAPPLHAHSYGLKFGTGFAWLYVTHRGNVRAITTPTRRLPAAYGAPALRSLWCRTSFVLCPSACSRGGNRLERPEAQQATENPFDLLEFLKPVEHEMRVRPLPYIRQPILLS